MYTSIGCDNDYYMLNDYLRLCLKGLQYIYFIVTLQYINPRYIAMIIPEFAGTTDRATRSVEKVAATTGGTAATSQTTAETCRATIDTTSAEAKQATQTTGWLPCL